MKKVLLFTVLVILGFSFISPIHAANLFSRTFTPMSNYGLTSETSGSVESVAIFDGLWVFTAGGNVATTHYARVKYKLPEQETVAPTKFYMRANVILPTDFYSKQTAGFRIMNTDNFGVLLNGVRVGAAGVNEFRTGVYFNSDHSIRINSSHDTFPTKEFFKMPAQLPVGYHVLEFTGDVANISPWYFKIDGQVIAYGNDRLSPDTVPVNERVITRMVAGIDGAADLDLNSMSLQISEVVFADYDPTGNATPTPPPPSKPGDANEDLKVDETDYGIWLAHYAQTGTGGVTIGDFNGDAKVDGIDFSIWTLHYGR